MPRSPSSLSPSGGKATEQLGVVAAQRVRTTRAGWQAGLSTPTGSELHAHNAASSSTTVSYLQVEQQESSRLVSRPRSRKTKNMAIDVNPCQYFGPLSPSPPAWRRTRFPMSIASTSRAGRFSQTAIPICPHAVRFGTPGHATAT